MSETEERETCEIEEEILKSGLKISFQFQSDLELGEEDSQFALTPEQMNPSPLPKTVNMGKKKPSKGGPF